MVSIIMPIYNAEKYLRESLDSIVPQLDSKAELILVNDGSKDNSLKICLEYAEREKQIRIINKENGGVSEARNVGIANAKRQYILFVDADDLLEKDALAEIMRELKRKKYPDLLMWGFRSIGGGKAFNDINTLRAHPEGFDPREFLSHLISIEKNARIIGVIWRCAFKRSLLDNNGVRFITNLKMAEDYKFLLDAAFFAKHIDTLGKELYVYRTSNGSVTEKYKSNIHSDMAWINNWIRTNVCTRYPEVEEGLDCCCAETYIVAMQNLCKADSPYNLQNRIKVAREIRKNNDYSRCIRVAGKQGKKISAKRRIIYYLLCMHCDAVYMFLYSIKRKSLFGAHEHEILAS
jgi:glycosyltransferase involved in cell wall biosynthesis